MAIGIDPTVDFAFKKMLGSPEHTTVTIHFLNAVLCGAPRITHVEILNPILEQESENDKLAILDVKAQDNQGRWFNIEMQTTNQPGLRQRLAYYAASLYVGQMRSGDAYHDLRPAISICVLDAVLFPSVPELHLDFRLRNDRHGLVLSDDIQVHFLELPKYNPDRPPVTDAPRLEKWAYFFRYAPQLTPDEIRERLTDVEFSEAAGVLEMIAQSPREREMYEARLKFERDQAWRIKAAKDEGRNDGRTEGRAEGIERGELSGRIRVLQVLLGLPESPLSELAEVEIEQLSRLANQLHAQVSGRR
jgi:predicted transposase/invertase (TIGR01784 family)